MKGMLTRGKQQKTIVLEYRGWQIILEPNFPSHNYVLTKKNASHGFRPAYCDSLESSLKRLYEQIVIANIIDKDSNYGGELADLREVIIRTKNEFGKLVSPGVKEMICEGERKIS